MDNRTSQAFSIDVETLPLMVPVFLFFFFFQKIIYYEEYSCIVLLHRPFPSEMQ